MVISVTTVEDYINQLPENRENIISKLRNIIQECLPSGFTETRNIELWHNWFQNEFFKKIGKNLTWKRVVSVSE